MLNYKLLVRNILIIIAPNSANGTHFKENVERGTNTIYSVSRVDGYNIKYYILYFLRLFSLLLYIN